MALIIEDGSIVANANSYVTEAEYQAYALQRSKTIGSDTAAREAELVKAMDYLFGLDYQGVRTNSTQAQPFPRYNVFLYGYTLNSDQIPNELKNAQMELAIASYSSDILTSGSFSNVQKEKLDTLEISYFSRGKAGKFRSDAAMNYLKPLLVNLDEVTRA